MVIARDEQTGIQIKVVSYPGRRHDDAYTSSTSEGQIQATHKGGGLLLSDGIYGSTFYMATGFHGFHV
jgi:Cytochrome c oxidase subunit III